MTTLLLLLLLTVILALPLAAVGRRFERHGAPRRLGVLVGAVLAVALVALALWLILPSLVSELRRLAVSLPAILADVRAQLAAVGIRLEPGELGAMLRERLFALLDTERLLAAGMTLAQVLGAVLLVAISTVYLALNPDPLVRGLVLVVRPEHRPRARRVLERLQERWLGWLRGIGLDMLITGALTYLALTVVGLDYALVFAALTALLEFVPYLGPIIAAVPPTVIALSDSPEKALLVLGVYVAIQQVEGQLILPLVMAQTVDLHPAAIAFGVVILGALFGLIGVLVAVPVLSAIVILVDELRVQPMEAAGATAADRPGRAQAESRGPGPEAERVGAL
jgi:predicted PurR-regulated permease PerM